MLAACHRLVEDAIVKLEPRDHTLINGGTLVTMDPSVPNLSIGDVLIAGDRITAVGADLSSAAVKLMDASRVHRHAGFHPGTPPHVARGDAPLDVNCAGFSFLQQPDVKRLSNRKGEGYEP